MNMPNSRPWLCLALVLLALAIVAVAWRPVTHIFVAKASLVDERESPPAGFLDDASRLNQTRVAEVVEIALDREDPEEQIRELLARARTEGLRVSIAGARHSMGGHTLYPGGVVLNMLGMNEMELDEEREILLVQAGAVWADILVYLDARGRSVQIMQSNNSFSVGGSISVNCHGWQYGLPPIASTVESLRLMLADGRVVRCSRTEEPELFSLVLGGYGLFGVILDVELRITNNERYRLVQTLVPTAAALDTFDAEIRDEPGLKLVYSRLNIVPDSFLDDVMISAFYRAPGGELPALTDPGLDSLRNAIFRGSENSDYGKRLRWTAETKLQPLLKDEFCSRNQLLNESVEVFANRAADRTDILHEYFVPRLRVEEFADELRRIIPAHEVDLLNITVRAVNEDTDTFLRYATEPMIALVMLFSQDRDAAGDAKMLALTRELIDASLAHEGRYYLPYRLHASREQFLAAYPQAPEFFARKRKYDPGELFQNYFYLEYGAPDDTTSRPPKSD